MPADVRQFSEAEATRLVQFYETAEREILDRLNRALLRGNKTEYLTMMKENIEAILNQLRAGNRTWCTEAIPRVYSQGLFSADAMLKDADVSMKAGFGAIHQQAAQVLAENTFESLDRVAQLIGRRTEGIYRDLALENIRGSVAGYDTWKQVAKNYREQLAERGVTGFQDAAGRNRSMRSYAEMVARTSTMEAHLQGTANRLLEQGHDLVKVSTHSGACELCQPWQGEVLSLTGKTPGYPTIQEARAAGLFHPNCLHAYGLHIDLDKEIEELEELEKARKQEELEATARKTEPRQTEPLQTTDTRDTIKIEGVPGPELIDSRTGDAVKTEYRQFTAAELKGLKKAGWNFDWEIPIRDGYDVYGLTLPGESEPQALVAFKINKKDLYADLNLLETAPHNYGSKGLYRTTAPRLVAMVAKESFEQDCDGYMKLTAKTKLIEYYNKALGAVQVGTTQDMIIDTRAALELIKKYGVSLGG